ncbi:MAG: 4Fe-4S dicluster domain-containing protein [Verrucomicrobia bacterium]|nr:4Fe-4S dicluster domain-containing protein [Verrucomicrobiota bacterium]
MSDTPFEKQHGDRRRFFRALFHRVAEPVADAVERPLKQFEQVLEQTGHAEPALAPPPAVAPTVLRPPGALAEEEFLSACHRTGQCAAVCPVQAIKFLAADDLRWGGTPYIEPEMQACVMCNDVPCARACPSGALQPVQPEEIRIGVAEWALESCLRTMGQECRECVDKCPAGTRAIELDESSNLIMVKLEGCTGCGVCQQHCPTYPKAITVRPR